MAGREKPDGGSVTDTIPASTASEEALLYALLLEPGAIDEVEGHVHPEMFFDSRHEGIYKAVQHLRKSGRGVDSTTVVEALHALRRADIVDRVFEITNIPRMPNVGDLVTEVRAVYQRRQLMAVCRDLAARAQDLSVPHREYFADVESRIASIVSSSEVRGDGLRKLDPHVAYEAIIETINSKGRINQTTTLRALDLLTSGLGRGHLMVIGGLPGSGKTGMAIQLLEDVAVKRGQVAAFFSLEMPEADIAKRLLSRGSGVCLASMRSGNIGKEEIEQMAPVKTQLGIAPVFVYDSPAPTIGTMRSEARRLKARAGGLAIVVVDYLQLARGVTKTDQREQEVAEVSRGLKAMAKELDCPVVALAQLNADGAKRANQRPRASDLRESKAIWQDADTVVLIHNPNLDKIESGQHRDEGDRQLILDKNRHGPCGVVDVTFDRATATFRDIGGRS
jgi:replicative DNA helicase